MFLKNWRNEIKQSCAEGEYIEATCYVLLFLLVVVIIGGILWLLGGMLILAAAGNVAFLIMTFCWILPLIIYYTLKVFIKKDNARKRDNIVSCCMLIGLSITLITTITLCCMNYDTYSTTTSLENSYSSSTIKTDGHDLSSEFLRHFFLGF